MDKMDRKITLADIFLDVLSKSEDRRTQVLAERIKAAIKLPEILELVNVCVVNAMGMKCSISNKTVNRAVDGIIAHVHSEIDMENISDEEKIRNKADYKSFAECLRSIILENLNNSGQLIIEC